MNAKANLRVRAECREWLTLMHSGDASEADHARFDAWLHSDPQHERAYAKLQGLWGEIGELQHLAALEPVPPVRTAIRPARWQHARLAVAAGIAGLAMLIAWQKLTESPTQPSVAATVFEQSYATALAEVREVSLPDGSTLTLGAHSKASVNFTADKRRVRLAQGEAFFSVAKDATKPFHVDAGNATVQVIGTRFEVHRGSERVRIAVAEGVVAVGGAAAPLTDGQRIDVLPNGTLTALDTITDKSVGAWREGRLIYENTALDEVMADISRYRSDVIVRPDGSGALRVTAGFRIDQIDQFLNGLPAILPVRVIRDGHSIAIDARD